MSNKTIKVGQVTLSLVYNWKNLETGEMGTGLFSASHHPMFGDPLGYSVRSLEVEQLRMIGKWNANQPSKWRYWL